MPVLDIDITIILGNKQRQLPKPFNNRPGYDMKYVVSYINNYHPIYYKEFEKLFDIERSYDNLSIVRQKENVLQWAVRVRANLQDLLIEKKFSMYHRYCIFASYPGGRLVCYSDFQNYYRPKPLKNGTAICFRCWKVFRANVDIKPKKTLDYAYKRFAEMVKPKDLMQDHWDNERSRPKTDFGRAKIIQQAWRNFKKRPESLASKVWNAVRNDGTPNEKKYFDECPHVIVEGSDPQRYFVKDQYGMIVRAKNRENAEKLLGWRIYTFEEWAGDKRSQLNVRLCDNVKDLLKQCNYRLVNHFEYIPWWILLKWVQNPEYYLNNGCGKFVRIE